MTKQRAPGDAGNGWPKWLQAEPLHGGPFITHWQVSKLMPKPREGVAGARHICVKNRAAGWNPLIAEGHTKHSCNFVDLHSRFGECDGLVYLAHRLVVPKTAPWRLTLGHDGGARLFVDGACLLTEPRTVKPSAPGRSTAHLQLARGTHEIVVAFDLAAGKGWGIFFQALATESLKPIVIHDLSVCQPRHALAHHRKRGCWKVMPYETTDYIHKGMSLQALTYTGAPEVVLPLNARGWHAVYVGISAQACDDVGGRNAVRLKLSRDAAFQHRATKASQGLIEEVLFKCADLTGQSLHIAQQNSGYPWPACIYYVMLAPLSAAEVRALQRDIRQRETKQLIGTIDGGSFLWERMPTTRAELLEEFEPFRNTDFGTLWWGFGGADQCNYRSRLGTNAHALTTDFARRGDEYATRAVKTLIRKGVDLTRFAVDACHAMGIQIHISMRPAAWKWPPPFEDQITSHFYETHPEWRCRDRNGTEAPRMSFAIPEVRQHLLGIFRETLEAGPDGLNMLYNRGVPLILWEDAFCSRFREVYGADARAVPEDDPRLYDLRGEFMTQWMREIRQLLDTFRRERRLKKRLKLSAMCLETEADNRMYGLDVARWVREGLIDQIGVCQGVCHTSGNPIELAWFRRITAGTSVSVYPGMVAWALPKPKDVLRQAVDWYDGHANGLLVWDASAKVTDGVMWPIVSRLGHEEEIRARARATPPAPTIETMIADGSVPGSRWTAWAGG